MIIKSLYLKGFKSFIEENISFEKDITTFVGENSIGKSAVAIAISKVLQQGMSDGDLFVPTDYPYQVLGPLSIKVTIELLPDEVNTLLISPLMPKDIHPRTAPLLQEWLQKRGNIVEIWIERPNEHPVSRMQWGNVHLAQNLLTIGKTIDLRLGAPRWTAIARPFGNGDMKLEKFEAEFQLQHQYAETPLPHSICQLAVIFSVEIRQSLGSFREGRA